MNVPPYAVPVHYRHGHQMVASPPTVYLTPPTPLASAYLPVPSAGTSPYSTAPSSPALPVSEVKTLGGHTPQLAMPASHQAIYRPFFFLPAILRPSFWRSQPPCLHWTRYPCQGDEYAFNRGRSCKIVELRTWDHQGVVVVCRHCRRVMATRQYQYDAAYMYA